MVSLRAPAIALRASLLVLASCGGLMPDLRTSSTRTSTAPPQDPTPVAKCKVAVSSSNPLVTEWPASEKAHLQSLTTAQTVAVSYSGCELKIIDACRLPGRYAWQHTTLASDQVEINDADELYAKLPLGAVGLEGELQRSGHLAVKTTVSGQLRSAWAGGTLPAHPSCLEATHFISAISVGSFQLVSGGEGKVKGGVGVMGLGGGARSSRAESLLRESGSRAACDKATDEAMEMQCASPIQVFLAPLGPKNAPPPSVVNEEARATGVHIAFPAPKETGEVWNLRAQDGRIVCSLPCQAWVPANSGYVLRRERQPGTSEATVPLPSMFDHTPGTNVTADYQAERGSPTWSRWAAYASIPMGAVGVGFTTWGIVQATRTCDDDPRGSGRCFPSAGLLLTFGIVNLAFAVPGVWWYFHSRPMKFETYEGGRRTSEAPGVRIGLGGIEGRF